MYHYSFPILLRAIIATPWRHLACTWLPNLSSDPFFTISFPLVYMVLTERRQSDGERPPRTSNAGGAFPRFFLAHTFVVIHAEVEQRPDFVYFSQSGFCDVV